MRSIRAVWLGVAITLVSVAPARADATVFLGANTTPANRPVKGFAIGAGLLIAAFEFEYAVTSSDLKSGAPSLKTGTGNVLLQTPFEIHGVQPYVTAGLGVFRERLEDHTETNFVPSTGAGVKITLAGPIRLRVDYRVFRLGDGALYSPAHRIYAGLNLKF
jgi:opacity protein-like surface antigen